MLDLFESLLLTTTRNITAERFCSISCHTPHEELSSKTGDQRRTYWVPEVEAACRIILCNNCHQLKHWVSQSLPVEN